MVEPIDLEILADPQATIIDPGGSILYVVSGDVVAGTVALKHQGDGVYELNKMAVTAEHRGRGLGRQLLCAAVERFIELKGEMLYLESNSSLSAAVALYESAGFRHEAPPGPSDYAGADIYMVFRGE